MAQKPSTPAEFTSFDYSLYAGVVFLWGTSWIALHWQLGVVAPEVSLLWRFIIAATVMLGWALVARVPLRFGADRHLLFAGQGLTLFCLNFVLFYHAGLTIPSGLLAVVFSLASVVSMLLAYLVHGEKPARRMLVGGCLGFAGVAAMFEPQIAGTDFDAAALAGLGFAIAGTISFCLGSLISRRTQAAGVPVAASTAWGMGYGVAFLLILCLAFGHAFTIEPTARYLGSLVYLGVFASVFAFMAYLTLLGRIGAERASYSTVLYPVIALVISTVFEGYRWEPIAVAGLALVIVGNVVVLTRRSR